MSVPVDAPPPPTRALAFARSVLGRHARGAVTRVSTADRVLLRPVRPHVVSDRRRITHSSSLHLRVDLGARERHTERIERRNTVWRSAEAGRNGVDGRDAAAHSATVTTIVRDVRAQRPDAGRTPIVLRAPIATAAIAARPSPQRGAGRRAPEPVPLVHRASAAATARPDQRSAAAIASPLGLTWTQQSGAATASIPPLTAADVPLVVDQVVREIDRRVVASRERRGWTS